MNDLRYTLRMMRRTPMFTFAVVLTVALAIAANTAIFSVVNAVLLRPLPYQDPAHIVQVAEKNHKLHLPNFGASLLNFVSWREQTHTRGRDVADSDNSTAPKVVVVSLATARNSGTTWTRSAALCGVQRTRKRLSPTLASWATFAARH
jgi:hypothetical protein